MKVLQETNTSKLEPKEGGDSSSLSISLSSSVQMKGNKKNTKENEDKKNKTLQISRQRDQREGKLTSSVTTFFSSAHLVAASNPTMDVKEIRALYGQQELLDPEDDPSPILRPKVPLSLMSNLEGYGKVDPQAGQVKSSTIASKGKVIEASDSNSKSKLEGNSKSNHIRTKTEELVLQASIGFTNKFGSLPSDRLISKSVSPTSKLNMKKSKVHSFPNKTGHSSFGSLRKGYDQQEDVVDVLLQTIKTEGLEDASIIWER